MHVFSHKLGDDKNFGFSITNAFEDKDVNVPVS